MTESIDVRCTETGTWSVLRADADAPVSTHSSETEAEQAAQEHAAGGAARVFIHDRYERVHECPPIAASGPSAAEAPLAVCSLAPQRSQPTPGPPAEHAGLDDQFAIEQAASAASPDHRHRWLLGLEPFFEGGWLHKGTRAHRWDVEPELAAVALLGDVTVDLSQTRTAPPEIALNAWAILRDVDVTVPAGTRVEITGDGFRGQLVNHVPASLGNEPQRTIRIHGHAFLGDVTVRPAAAADARREMRSNR
jgi:Uncharacterized protein conserved in bacteria (DUF2188)